MARYNLRQIEEAEKARKRKVDAHAAALKRADADAVLAPSSTPVPLKVGEKNSLNALNDFARRVKAAKRDEILAVTRAVAHATAGALRTGAENKNKAAVNRIEKAATAKRVAAKNEK